MANPAIELTDADRSDIADLLIETTRFRMQCRVDACLERHGGNVADAVTSSGIGISYMFARDIVHALEQAAAELGCLRAENEAYRALSIHTSADAQRLYRALVQVERCDEIIRQYADAGISGTIHDIERRLMREDAMKIVHEIRVGSIPPAAQSPIPATTSRQEGVQASADLPSGAAT